MSREEELEETRVLLEEFKKLGLKAPINELSKIIGVNPSTVSSYGKPRRGQQKAQPMPLRHRLTVRAYLEKRQGTMNRRATDKTEPLYPSQRVAIAHELIEELGQATHADDAAWVIVITTIEAALKASLPKEIPPPTRLAEGDESPTKSIAQLIDGDDPPIVQIPQIPLTQEPESWLFTNVGTPRSKHTSINSSLPDRPTRPVVSSVSPLR